MTRIAIRKSGGANIISVPKAILKILGLHTGSTVDLKVEDSKIILSPVNETLTLEDLIADSPKGSLAMSEEDREWLDEKPQGKEEKF